MMETMIRELRDRVKECLHQPCRSCRRLVWIFEDICPTCGCYAPYRVPYAVAILVGVCCLCAVILIRYGA